MIFIGQEVGNVIQIAPALPRRGVLDVAVVVRPVVVLTSVNTCRLAAAYGRPRGVEKNV